MRRVALIVVMTLLAGMLTALLALIYNLPLDTRDPAPVQPLAFSHSLHAGDYRIACRYCHRGVEISRTAGIPPLATCQACHLHIASDRPEIVKLLDQMKREEPVEWVKVYDLPEHVYFPHMMHLRAQLDCALCHGDVAGMERITRSVELKMGWCLGCHREHLASIDCWTCHI
ncbi:MAG: cytochrome c family protein [Desulfuromonadales bacterium]|nr:cytochrome c family protein [Desulfuromonadales bacterium]